MAEIKSFLDYNKISDILMFFTQEVTLKFNVTLSRTKNGKRIPFHSEFAYKDNNGFQSYSIKRVVNCYFSIDDTKDFNNSILIRPQDISLLQMIMNNNIIPWIMGPKRIFGMDNENRLIIKGKFTKIDFPLSEYKYISFIPIVITYTDDTSKEGIRMIINNSSNVIDIDINKFMEFYYYICNTDMYNAAIGLMNYIKMSPHGENLMDLANNGGRNNYKDSMSDWNQEKNDPGKKNDFFEKLK